MAESRIFSAFRHPLGLFLTASLAAGLIGHFIHPQGHVVLTGLICVQFLGLIGPWINLAGCKGQVEPVSDRAWEGDRVAVEITVANRSFLPAVGMTFQAETLFECGICQVAGRGIYREVRRFEPPRRGGYLGRCRLGSAFPFGLLWRWREAVCSRELLVWPRTFPVVSIPDEIGREHHDGWRLNHRVGTGGDFLAVRPYRRGDELRHVHWGQTARHDQLVVCEFQAPARPTAMIIVDGHPKHHHGEGGDHSLEWALRIAASFVAGWIDAGVPVGLRIGSRQFPPECGARHKRALLDALALWEPESVTLGQALDGLEQRGDELQVVIATAAALAGLPPRHRRLSQRRFVVLSGPAFVRPGEEARLSVQPWLEITDPARAARQLLQPRKEAAHES